MLNLVAMIYGCSVKGGSSLGFRSVRVGRGELKAQTEGCATRTLSITS